MRLHRTSLSILLVALSAPALLRAQAPAAPQHPTSTPYAGDLGIFEDPNRAKNLQVDRVMDLLDLKPGKVVADIGAGGGWFSVRAARRVEGRSKNGKSHGEVLAEDINPKYIDAIRQRAQKEGLTDIVPLLGTPDDPHLPPDSIDAALMLKVYHEIAHPETLLSHLHAAMRPGARFGIIDRNGHGDDHGLDEKIVRGEVERNGFRLVGRYDFTKADGQDYFLIFEKK
jgi:ubiquinone/menaquinone biosynthesis C-methylase UbiE